MLGLKRPSLIRVLLLIGADGTPRRAVSRSGDYGTSPGGPWVNLPSPPLFIQFTQFTKFIQITQSTRFTQLIQLTQILS